MWRIPSVSYTHLDVYKRQPFAAQTAAETAAKAAMEHGLKTVEVYVKGPGAGLSLIHIYQQAAENT